MTHIKEVGERLDTRAFWKGREDTKGAGNAFWEIGQDLADSYPCPPCKPGAQALMHGGHDVINLLLGKPVVTPRHLEQLFRMVDMARHIYEAHGEHLGKRHIMEVEHR